MSSAVPTPDNATGIRIQNPRNGDELFLRATATTSTIFPTPSIPTTLAAGAITDEKLQVENGNVLEISYQGSEDPTDNLAVTSLPVSTRAAGVAWLGR